MRILSLLNYTCNKKGSSLSCDSPYDLIFYDINFIFFYVYHKMFIYKFNCIYKKYKIYLQHFYPFSISIHVKSSF